MTTALHPHEGVKLKTASGGSYQKPLKSFGDLTFKTQYCTGFTINLSTNSPPVSCSTSEDPIKLYDGPNLYILELDNPINLIDSFGLKCTYKGTLGAPDVNINSVDFIRFDFTPHILRGGTALGLVGAQFRIYGSVSANIKCEKICDDKCEDKNYRYNLETMEIPINKDVTVGIGYEANTNFAKKWARWWSVMKYSIKAIKYGKYAGFADIAIEIANRMASFYCEKNDPTK